MRWSMVRARRISTSGGRGVARIYKTNPKVPEYKYRASRIPGLNSSKATISYQCAKQHHHLNQCPKMNCTCECHTTGRIPPRVKVAP